MKTFWGAVVAVVVAVSLTGCGEAAVAGPAGAHRTGVAVERTWTPAPVAPEAVPTGIVPAEPVAPAEVPVVASKPRPVAPAASVAPAPPAPAPVEVAPAPPAVVEPDTRDYSMFPCADGYAPGWLDEQGEPTGCVGN
jgi:hypothetical protein